MFWTPKGNYFEKQKQPYWVGLIGGFWNLVLLSEQKVATKWCNNRRPGLIVERFASCADPGPTPLNQPENFSQLVRRIHSPLNPPDKLSQLARTIVCRSDQPLGEGCPPKHYREGQVRMSRTRFVYLTRGRRREHPRRIFLSRLPV